MTKVAFLRMWSLAMGSMDNLTGILLVFFPSFVLDLLRIPPPSPDALVFINWIGIFVISVGMSYGLALGVSRQGRTVWIFTSFVRYMVAAFITCRAIADAWVDIVQTLILRAGLWKEVRR